MAHSLIGADRKTHLRIAAVAAAAVAVFIGIGVAAHMSDFEAVAALMQNQPVVKAGKPAIYTSGYDVTIR